MPVSTASPRGLSPPMRGNRRPPRGGLEPRGSIPAHAGKPSSRAARRRHAWVYPRPCGETFATPGPATRNPGLSPPMRGNLTASSLAESSPRSIPAHAGKPSRNTVGSSASRVYPRPCGETSPEIPVKLSEPGLSPPMRGNRCAAFWALTSRGSIPAHAGKPLGTNPLIIFNLLKNVWINPQ